MGRMPKRNTSGSPRGRGPSTGSALSAIVAALGGTAVLTLLAFIIKEPASALTRVAHRGWLAAACIPVVVLFCYMWALVYGERWWKKRSVKMIVGSLALLAVAFAAVAVIADPEEPDGPLECPQRTTKGILFPGRTYDKGVAAVEGVAVRAAASLDSQILKRLPGGCDVDFIGYCLGETVRDQFSGHPDMRWFVLPGTRGVIASGVIAGNPPADALPMPCRGSRPPPHAAAFRAEPGPSSSSLQVSAIAGDAPIVGFAAALSAGSSPDRWIQIAWDREPKDGFRLDWNTATFLDSLHVDHADVVIAAVACVARKVPSGEPKLVSVTLDRASAPSPASPALGHSASVRGDAARAACHQ